VRKGEREGREKGRERCEKGDMQVEIGYTDFKIRFPPRACRIDRLRRKGV